MWLGYHICLGTKISFSGIYMHEIWGFKVNEVISCFDPLTQIMQVTSAAQI